MLPSGSRAANGNIPCPSGAFAKPHFQKSEDHEGKRINKLPANDFFFAVHYCAKRYKLSSKQPSVYPYKYVLYYYQKESSTGVQLNRQQGWFTPNSYLSRSVLIFDCLHLCEGHQNVLPRCCDMGLVINPIPEIHRPEQISISRKCYSNEITGKSVTCCPRKWICISISSLQITLPRPPVIVLSEEHTCRHNNVIYRLTDELKKHERFIWRQYLWELWSIL